MINIGNTILYTFLGVLQVYIFYSIGLKTNAKKIFTKGGNDSINKILVNIIIPIYSICEISSIFSLENFQRYYFLTIFTVFAVCFKLFIVFMINYLMNNDVKIIHINTVVNTFPSISLALVIANSLCQNNCPLYGDPLCENTLGFVMIISAFNKIVMFSLGYFLAFLGSEKNMELTMKLSYTYYEFLSKSKREDQIVKYLFYKYIEDKQRASEEYSYFKENFILKCENNKYEYYNNDPENENVNNKDLLKNKSSAYFLDNHDMCKSYRHVVKLQSKNIKKYSPNLTNIYFKLLQQHELDEIHIEVMSYKEMIKNYYSSAFDLIENYLDEKEQEFNKNHCNEINEDNCRDYIESLKNDIKNKEFSTQFVHKIQIEMIHDGSFYVLLKKILNFQRTKYLYDIEKSILPTFNIRKKTDISRDEENLVNEIWEKLQKHPLASQCFNNDEKEKKSFIHEVIAHLVNPPIIGSLLGLFFGFSGLRNILFSHNHYIYNMFSTLKKFYKCYVPLFASMLGNNMLSPNYSIDTTLKKRHIVASFIIYFIISAGLGIGITLISRIISDEISNSKVLMFMIFLPYSLIIDSTMASLLFMVKGFYMSEYLNLFKYQMGSFFILQTAIYVIYFIIADSVN